jgi:methyltransferase (TIGR00027 family)
MTTKSTPMDEGQPSSTARRAAMLRAAHQILDNPKVLDDPMALRIIGTEGESWLRSNLERLQEARFLRAFIVARSRYAEDELAEAIQRGTRQYVILGAGLETFPYRNPYAESRLHVYEVDHPATQSWKRKRLLEAGITIPNSLTFVPVDFERQTLADGLSQTGFKANQPVFFSFLGVIIYLTREAVMDTFGFVASLPPGSEIVFDCPVPTSSLSEAQELAREARADRMAAIGEPWRTYFDPPSLASDLRQMGFKQIEDLGPEAANKRYFEDRTDGLRLAGGGHLMKARV